MRGDAYVYRCDVGVGDREAYARAFIKAQYTVKDPILQLALVDSILAARIRAYGQ